MKRKSIERYLFPANGNDEVQIIKSLKLVKELCRRYRKNVNLFVPTRNIKYGNIKNVLGYEIINNLLKNEQVNLSDSCNLELLTKRTLIKNLNSDIIWGIYVDKGMLNQIDDNCRDCTAIVIVHREMNDVKDWIKAWNPVVYGKEHRPVEILIPDNEFGKELKSLTNDINLDDGLTNLDYKLEAKQTLRKLNIKYTLYPDNIRAWAMRHCWKSEDADELRKIAQKIIKNE